MIHDTTVILTEETAIKLVEQLLDLHKILSRELAKGSNAPLPLRDYFGTLHSNLRHVQRSCYNMCGELESIYGFETIHGASCEPQLSDSSRTPTWHPR